MTDQSRRDAMKLTAAAGAAAVGSALLSGGAAFGQVREPRRINFESINADVERFGIRDEAGVATFAERVDAQQARAAIGDSICPAYRAVRGILIGISLSGLLPRPWRIAIDAFVAAMDKICGID